MGKLDGKVAIVTGASRGIGAEISRLFAKEGAKVVCVARTLKEGDHILEGSLELTCSQIRESGGEATAIAANISLPEDCERLVEETKAAYGPADVLVNNAGTSQTGAFEDITDETWQFDIDLKLMAAVRLCRLALPGMKQRKWGRIINILNTAAKAPRGGSAPTAVTRAAGMALTKVLAGEGAPHNVLVNALCTGIIESGQWVRWREALAPEMPMDQFLSGMAVVRGVPLGRLGTAEEFANMACFLASDAGSYITGTAINVDGGLSPVV